MPFARNSAIMEDMIIMKRTYRVTYSSKSKLIKDADKIKEVEKSIVEEAGAKSAKIEDEGQIVTVEFKDENTTDVMAIVVNIFRKLDAKSEVTYRFELNGCNAVVNA
jgi:hypothetical protein